MDNALEKLADLALELQEATHMALRSPADKKSPVKIKITICTGPVVTSKPPIWPSEVLIGRTSFVKMKIPICPGQAILGRPPR
jgi:hypothetical protein